MSFPHRFFIFVEASKITPANNQAAAWDPDTGGLETFGVTRLSPSGNEPATHYSCDTAANDNMKSGIETALGLVPWSGMYKASDDWTWTTALADMGLQVIYE